MNTPTAAPDKGRPTLDEVLDAILRVVRVAGDDAKTMGDVCDAVARELFPLVKHRLEFAPNPQTSGNSEGI